MSANNNRTKSGPRQNLGFSDVPCQHVSKFLNLLPPGIDHCGTLNSEKPGTSRLLLTCDDWEQMPWPKTSPREVRLDIQYSPSALAVNVMLAEYKPLHLAASELAAGASLDAQRAASTKIPNG